MKINDPKIITNQGLVSDQNRKFFLKQKEIEMLTILKTGQIKLDEKVVCSRPGVIIDLTLEEGTKFSISPLIKNPYTISIASQGILLSFYAIKKKMLKDYDIEASWFVDFNYAYFLSTNTKVDGYDCYWTEGNPFGQILLSIANEECFQALDKNIAYIFFLDLTTGTITLSYVYDVPSSKFIIPSKWNVPKFCNNPKFVIEKYGEKAQTALTKEEKSCPIVINEAGSIVLYCPLLVTIYSDTVYNIRIISKNDMMLLKIKSRSIDKYIALLIAHFKNENTEAFVISNFSVEETKNFKASLESGLETFKNDIFKKSQHKWVQFPDKIFNTIRLGDIIMEKISVEEKQKRAIEELKKCTYGWKLKALYEFYKFYMLGATKVGSS